MVARGEVRWAAVDKQRPVLLLHRDSVIRRLTSIIVAPCTTTVRGRPSEVPLGTEEGMPQSCVVSLDNTTQIEVDSLGSLITTLSTEKMAEVCSALAAAVGCELYLD